MNQKKIGQNRICLTHQKRSSGNSREKEVLLGQLYRDKLKKEQARRLEQIARVNLRLSTAKRPREK